MVSTFLKLLNCQSKNLWLGTVDYTINIAGTSANYFNRSELPRKKKISTDSTYAFYLVKTKGCYLLQAVEPGKIQHGKAIELS